MGGKMFGSMFWLSIGIVVLFGTLGGVLYKHGTNTLGTITFERLLQMELSSRVLLYLTVMAVGVLLFVYGGYSLRNECFAMGYLFSPIIFLALVTLFISRFLAGIPLSVTGLGRLTATVTVLTVITTAAASSIVFKEAYTPRVIVGIILGALAVLLIGEVG
jgi:uncharacterized membrane protein